MPKELSNTSLSEALWRIDDGDFFFELADAVEALKTKKMGVTLRAYSVEEYMGLITSS